MNNRNYNIFFHLHTVSGIVISVLLYVIFFAGSFSFFRDEITNWQRNQAVEVTQNNFPLDIDTALDTLNNWYTLKGKSITFNKYYEEQQVGVSITASQDSLVPADEAGGAFFYLNTKEYSAQSYPESYGLGEFLYRLHFLDQIPYPYGRYLSGFVAFFFLFALITGLLIHWDKLVANFYLFRPKAKLKVLWTDAHTALGTIGFPFQLMYAVTGTFFLLKILVVAPNVALFFNGDQNKMYADLEYNLPVYEYSNTPLDRVVSINKYISEVQNRWDNFTVTRVDVLNYADANMHVYVEGHLGYDTAFTGTGKISYAVTANKAEVLKEPYTGNTYLDGVKNILYRLHFADYAGYPLRIVSFVLGIIGCVVIISGVLIWFNARNKKNLSEKKKQFNTRVSTIYLAICLSMYPVTALSFIAVKVGTGSMSFLFYTYFISWLLLSVFFAFKNNNNFTNSYTLLLGSILGFCIPVVNGVVTGNWLWVTWQNHNFHMFFIDAFWLGLSAVTCYIYYVVRKRKA